MLTVCIIAVCVRVRVHVCVFICISIFKINTLGLKGCLLPPGMEGDSPNLGIGGRILRRILFLLVYFFMYDGSSVCRA